MSSSDYRPEKLTGGCLCEAIRYTISITPEMEWPPSLVSRVRYSLLPTEAPN